MNAVTPFTNGAFSVRTVEIDGDHWFVGKDVCEGLGYANPNKAMGDHCKGVPKRYPLQTAGGTQLARVLNEADVMRLIISSNLPAAQQFERWVFEEVLPSIRKTGSYQVAPKTQAEIVLASAQALVDFERRQTAVEATQAEQGRAIEQIQAEVKEVAQSRVFDRCPHNCEPISKARARIAEKYGLAERVIDDVMRRLPFSPKPFGEVRNHHEFALNSHYTVWAIADVSLVFKVFISECTWVSDAYATHPFIQGRFTLDRNKVPQPVAPRKPARLNA
ncbi:BRO-N domain-containing protein [Roseateles chitosanitabidus]|uniref:BRO-N domain-containing protein n=1 Tax=Roseateles chitosanitabidus TaxID=65048 RepID=UPI00082B28CB|nr:Bro-N domain-containing protein [Roseateles chitosanitabidus]